jgi:SAM-dependent methyltransferase
MYRGGDQQVLGESWTETYLNEVTPISTNWIYREILRTLPRTLLEIGPGNGKLLEAVSELGCKSYGLELGSWTSDPKIVTHLNQLDPDLRFDCVILQDVLEHLAEPREFLKSHLSKLSDDGFAYLSFPAGDSLEAKYFKADWEMIRPYGHLHYFSKESISRLAQELKCDIVSLKRFRRQNQSRAILRLLLLPILYAGAWKDGRKVSQKNPYAATNLMKFAILAISSGDQYSLILRKRAK